MYWNIIKFLGGTKSDIKNFIMLYTNFFKLLYSFQIGIPTVYLHLS